MADLVLHNTSLDKKVERRKRHHKGVEHRKEEKDMEYEQVIRNEI